MDLWRRMFVLAGIFDVAEPFSEELGGIYDGAGFIFRLIGLHGAAERAGLPL